MIFFFVITMAEHVCLNKIIDIFDDYNIVGEKTTIKFEVNI